MTEYARWFVNGYLKSCRCVYNTCLAVTYLSQECATSATLSLSLYYTLLATGQVKQMHMHISVHNSWSFQHTELKIKINIVIIAIRSSTLLNITRYVAIETLVMDLSNNYGLKIANFFKYGELNNRGTSMLPCTLVNQHYLDSHTYSKREYS